MGLFDRLAEMNRIVLLGGIALVGVIAVVIFFAMIGGGGGGEAALEEDFVDVVADPNMVSLEEMDAYVQATIVAMGPAPEPEPTPDVPATVTAELDAMKAATGSAVSLGPLDSRRIDTPFLSPEDIEYLEELGPPMWAHARIWLLLRDILRVEHVYWNVEETLPEAAGNR